MNDVDDDRLVFDSGYITPPLSPSKTISTEGWLSPKTPVSPRKIQSCLFFRDAADDSFLPTLPESATKVKHVSRLGRLPLESSDPIKSFLRSEDHVILNAQEKEDEHVRNSMSLSRLSSGSLSDGGFHSSPDSSDCSILPPQTDGLPAVDAIDGGEGNARSTIKPSSSTPISPPISGDYQNVTSPKRLNTTDIASSREVVGPLPPRQANSPLRPSQWTARGGLLCPQRNSRTPDRFISFRRPLNVTRESFELNKPAGRLGTERSAAGVNASRNDPFGVRFRRSVRMNEELRDLRETHTILTGRANPNRPGVHPGFRRGSLAIWNREVSAGAVWNVGGSSMVSDTVVGVPDGRGGMLGSGTNAPLYTSMFLSRPDPEAALEAYEQRVALALDIDQNDRLLDHSTPENPSTALSNSTRFHVWKDSAWTRDGVAMPKKRENPKLRKAVPILPFRVLDAPQLRDDYYCSLLAYSHTAKCLAVGLGNFVHLWSEHKGVDTPESLNLLSSSPTSTVQYVTSLAFSSAQGGQAILAVGRADGRIALWSPLDSEPRFDATQPKAISCVSFRPTIVKRPSLRDRATIVPTEELLIGDEAGHIYFYSVEWPSETESALFGWSGAMTLLARMTVHTQQICGLSWSIDGELFASGGNDNACYLFESSHVLRNPNPDAAEADNVNVRVGPNGESIYTVTPGRGAVLHIPATHARRKWELHAAVKAIAFCPWQRGLIAIGGGSNDRCIHFYHTRSGACLATIDCAAQVTSLIWSQTRREIAATFGFAQPEHPYRIAVFAWPSCEQVVSVPWFDEHRALYAIPYPTSPPPPPSGDEAVRWMGAEEEEGCIVVAASDGAIRFHEIWEGGKKGVGGAPGLLGGSEILEDLHGIDRDGSMIR